MLTAQPGTHPANDTESSVGTCVGQLSVAVMKYLRITTKAGRGYFDSGFQVLVHSQLGVLLSPPMVRQEPSQYGGKNSWPHGGPEAGQVESQRGRAGGQMRSCSMTHSRSKAPLLLPPPDDADTVKLCPSVFNSFKEVSILTGQSPPKVYQASSQAFGTEVLGYTPNPNHSGTSRGALENTESAECHPLQV